MNILTSSLKQISEAIRTKKMSAQEVTRGYFGQIEKWNPRLNAYVTLNEKALDQAKAIDERLAKGESVGALAGVPVAIKDMLCTKDLRTTAGSKILHNFVPPYSATVVLRL